MSITLIIISSLIALSGILFQVSKEKTNGAQLKKINPIGWLIISLIAISTAFSVYVAINQKQQDSLEKESLKLKNKNDSLRFAQILSNQKIDSTNQIIQINELQNLLSKSVEQTKSDSLIIKSQKSLIKNQESLQTKSNELNEFLEKEISSLETQLDSQDIQYKRLIHPIEKIRLQYALEIRSKVDYLDTYISRINEVTSRDRYLYDLSDSTWVIMIPELYPRRDTIEGSLNYLLNNLRTSISFYKTNNIDTAWHSRADCNINFRSELTVNEFVRFGRRFNSPHESIYYNPIDSTFKMFITTDYEIPRRNIKIESLHDLIGTIAFIDPPMGLSDLDIDMTFLLLQSSQGSSLEIPLKLNNRSKYKRYFSVLDQTTKWE